MALYLGREKYNVNQYADGFEAGKKSQYNEFWDEYQQNGARIDYRHAFAGIRWTPQTFKPKYPMEVTYGGYMFNSCNLSSLDGTILNTENLTLATQMFQSSGFTELPNINISKITASYNMGYLFGTCSGLITIKKLIVSENTAFINTMFTGTTNLENITFEGVDGTPQIAKNGLDLSPCTKLTHDSLMSLINCLKDVGEARTVTIGTANLAKLTDTEKAIATEKGWNLA